MSGPSAREQIEMEREMRLLEDEYLAIDDMEYEEMVERNGFEYRLKDLFCLDPEEVEGKFLELFNSFAKDEMEHIQDEWEMWEQHQKREEDANAYMERIISRQSPLPCKWMPKPSIMREEDDTAEGPRVPFFCTTDDDAFPFSITDQTYLYVSSAGKLCLSEKPIILPYRERTEEEVEELSMFYVAEDKTYSAGPEGLPQFLSPTYIYPKHTTEYRNRDLAEIQALSKLQNGPNIFAIEDKRLTDKGWLFMNAKIIKDYDTFYRMFNLQNGTGLPTITKRMKAKYKRSANKKYDRKPVMPWQCRECGNKKCRHKTARDVSNKHVYLRGAKNDISNDGDGEIGVSPFKPQKSLRRVKKETYRKKRARDACIAFRTYVQSRTKAISHQSDASTRIKELYDLVDSETKGIWALVAKEYTKQRDENPNVSRAWLTAMLAQVVDNHGLVQAVEELIAMFPHIFTLSGGMAGVPSPAPEGEGEETTRWLPPPPAPTKRAREPEEPDFGRVPKKAKVFCAEQKRRYREEGEGREEMRGGAGGAERPRKKARVRKGLDPHPAEEVEPIFRPDDSDFGSGEDV
ncbi:hypothetical protein H072_9577 [Dactylellina haptotyla CBS 200.50]|uniref:Uncharacterized protein n=1 Tax=Dactylellina haptotyla (strain CBS 200.50) TaxID=1284197 RepID=S8A6X9_DACHA|nr:hypothetical protein H072_9577 [Dactylellina haptotyla CBS 200.50]